MPEDVGPKEVYAFFGLAAYHAQVLEQGVLNLAVALAATGQGRIPTSAVVESLYERLETRTFGQLLAEARRFVEVTETLDPQLTTALEKRNLLVHRFFALHSENFLSQNGRRQMLTELTEIGLLFKTVTKVVDAVHFSLVARFGLTEELVEQEVRRLIEQAAERDAAV